MNENSNNVIMVFNILKMLKKMNLRESGESEPKITKNNELFAIQERIMRKGEQIGRAVN